MNTASPTTVTQERALAQIKRDSGVSVHGTTLKNLIAKGLIEEVPNPRAVHLLDGKPWQPNLLPAHAREYRVLGDA